MSTPFDLSSRVALVTGANTGIGQGIAVALAQAGADIAAADIAPLDETRGLVEAAGRRFHGIAADLTSIALVLATQARGTMLIHEWMYESRLYWVDRLIAMGARVILCDPHRAVVTGPAKLYGQVLTSPDIRAGMALLLASLCAQGESVIHNAQQIDRGYERIEERLTAIGAAIERID